MYAWFSSNFRQTLTHFAAREEQFYPAEPGTATLLCGPPGLIEHGAMPGLESMGFVKGENIFGF